MTKEKGLLLRTCLRRNLISCPILDDEGILLARILQPPAGQLTDPSTYLDASTNNTVTGWCTHIRLFIQPVMGAGQTPVASTVDVDAHQHSVTGSSGRQASLLLSNLLHQVLWMFI